MAGRTTIKDVAREASVSISTVSNYLNGNFANMSEATRARVAEAINALGYFPSLGAQALPRKRKTKTVCIVIPHDVDYTFHHTYFAEVMRGVAAVLAERDYQAMILTTRSKSPKEVGYIKGLTRGLVDGVIFFDVEEDDPFVREFGMSATPVIFVGRNESVNDRYVDNDVEGGAEQAVAHLLALGHRRIVLLNGPTRMVFSRQLETGLFRALSSAGLPSDAAHVVYGEFTEASGFVSAGRLVAESEPTTAIFAASGNQAVGVMRFADQNRIAIPGDLSLVSFGHHPAVGILGQKLTYLDQPEPEVGARAARNLITQIETLDAPVEATVIPLTLVVGDTTAAPARLEFPESPE